MCGSLEERPLPSENGYDLRLEVHADPMTDISEFPDVYPEGSEPQSAWIMDRWGFMEVHVVASRLGVELGRATIAGIEDGYMGEEIGSVGALRGYDPADLVSKAVASADRVLGELVRGYRQS